MKTKNLIISSFLVLIIASGIMFFISCKKQNDEILVVRDNNYALKNVGALHNEALAYYYENRVKLKSSSNMNEILMESVALTSEYLINQGFEKEEVMKVRTLVEKSLVKNSLKSSSDEILSIDKESFIEQLDNQNQYSDEFIENVNKLLIMAQNDVNEHSVKEYVNNVFAKVEYASQNDATAQEVYLNIFNSSFEFWINSPETSSLKSTRMKPSSWVILNDGIGGILGSPLGPIGSIALATAFSIGTNEEL